MAAQYDGLLPDTPKDLLAGTYEKITVSNVAIGITTAIRCPTSGSFKGMDAKAAYVIIEDNEIFWRCDGTAPTATTGMHTYAAADAHKAFVIYGSTNIKNFKMIRASADAIAWVTCFF